ncbi:MAG: SDR family NAD(P)-dependent oxidoreductase [Spirochaetota bacterium]
MRHVIITGASSGLGAALARTLLSPHTSLFCVSRSLNEELINESSVAGVPLHWIQADLAETLSIEAFMGSIADRIGVNEPETVALINNAAVLTPLGEIGTGAADELQRAVHVNLIAPVILTHSFVRHFGSYRCRRTVINVSSGAGTSPMPGLSTYSTTKAALNMFTRAAAAEHGTDDPRAPFRFYAVSPGTVDTGMQEALRAAGPSVVPNHGIYVGWKESGALVQPAAAARAVASLIDRDDVPNGAYVHRSELDGEAR